MKKKKTVWAIACGVFVTMLGVMADLTGLFTFVTGKQGVDLWGQPSTTAQPGPTVATGSPSTELPTELPPQTATGRAGEPGPSDFHFLDGRHVVGSVDGSVPSVVDWTSGSDYGLRWDLSNSGGTSYRFSLIAAQDGQPVRSVVWSSKDCGDVEFLVSSDDGRYVPSFSGFETDPDFPYEFRADLVFEPTTPVPEDGVLTISMSPRFSGGCFVFWGMFDTQR